MDYRNKYIQLKRYLSEAKYPVSLNRIDDIFKQHFCNLFFIVNSQILEPEAKSIIFSLINDFLKISNNHVDNNIELSHFFTPFHIKSKIHPRKYIECELVLRYYDNQMYVKNITCNKNQCDVGCGMIRFYLKCHEKSSNISYHEIYIVNLINDNMEKYVNKPYYSNYEMDELLKAINIAVAHEQSDTIHKHDNKFNIETINDVEFAGDNIKNLLKYIKYATLHTQLSKMHYNKFLVNVPDNHALSLSASLISSLKSDDDNSSKYLLVGGNEPLCLFTQAKLIPSNITNEGIILDPQTIHSAFKNRSHTLVAMPIHANVILINDSSINDITKYHKVTFNKNKDDIQDISQLINKLDIPMNIKIPYIVSYFDINILIPQLIDIHKSDKKYHNSGSLDTKRIIQYIDLSEISKKLNKK